MTPEEKQNHHDHEGHRASHLHNKSHVHYTRGEQRCTVIHLSVLPNSGLLPDSSCVIYDIKELERTTYHPLMLRRMPSHHLFDFGFADGKQH